MAKRVITTVGTSIFSNYQDKKTVEKLDNKYQSISDLVDRLDNLNANDYNVSRWKSPIRNIKERIQIIWLPFAQQKASAEIETLYKIAEAEGDLEVYLLATDTVLSVLACELIKEWFDKNPSVKDTNFKVKCYFHGDINAPDTTIVKGLQIQDADIFETVGFQNLLNIIKRFSEKGNTILNISGGYKAVIPFITLFAQLEEIPLKYAYEESESLITVGNLPFNFDWEFGEFYFDYLTKEGLKTINNYPAILDMLRSHGLIGKANYKLTILGQFFKDYICSILTDKKTHLGYFMELKFFEHFIKTNNDAQYLDIIHSKEYWWNMIDKSQFTYYYQYDKNDTKERKIDIDIFLLDKNDKEIWCEVKSCSETGLKSAKKQIATMLDFVEKTSYNSLKEIRLLLYKPSNIDINYHSRLLNEIKALFLNNIVLSLSIQYFELPKNINNTLNYKALFEKDIIFNTLN